MKFLTKSKDGGYESTVWAYTLIEIKSWFSIVLLRFDDGSRDAYHNHAFHCVSWLLSGGLVENHFDGRVHLHLPSTTPIVTLRSTMHKVVSVGTSWVLSFRGPWSKTWAEMVPNPHDEGLYLPTELTHGRKRVWRQDGGE